MTENDVRATALVRRMMRASAELAARAGQPKVANQLRNIRVDLNSKFACSVRTLRAAEYALGTLTLVSTATPLAAVQATRLAIAACLADPEGRALGLLKEVEWYVDGLLGGKLGTGGEDEDDDPSGPA